jgi:hypothetical protein
MGYGFLGNPCREVILVGDGHYDTFCEQLPAVMIRLDKVERNLGPSLRGRLYVMVHQGAYLTEIRSPDFRGFALKLSAMGERPCGPVRG